MYRYLVPACWWLLGAKTPMAAPAAAGSASAPDFEDDELPGLDDLFVHRSSSEPPPEAVVGPSMREYRSTSFGWRIWESPRCHAIRLIEWRGFEPLILLTILANCITMAWESPLDAEDTPKAYFIDVCEWLYLAIFTCELIVKVVAMGFVVHDGAYLRDSWCQLDFVVVAFAWLPIFFPALSHLSFIRSARALRPLRALKRLPGMPVLISSLFAAIPRLADVATLCGLLVLILGIVGTEEFRGVLHYRCASPGFHETTGHPSMLRPDDPPRLAGPHGRQMRTSGVGIPSNDFDTGIYCAPFIDDHKCVDGTACAYFDDNMNHGAATFDGFGWTCINILQAITFDAWTLSLCARAHADCTRREHPHTICHLAGHLAGHLAN